MRTTTTMRTTARTRTRRGTLATGAASAVIALTLAGCFGPSTPSTVTIALDCDWAGVPIPDPPMDVPGSITVSSKTPEWVDQGSTMPVLRDTTIVDQDLPMTSNLHFFLDVAGGTWNGLEVNGSPVHDLSEQPTVTAGDAPGPVDIRVVSVVVVDFVSGRPLGFQCTPVGTPPPLASTPIKAPAPPS